MTVGDYFDRVDNLERLIEAALRESSGKRSVNHVAQKMAAELIHEYGFKIPLPAWK